MSFWMWVIREMEVAVANCQWECPSEDTKCNEDSIHSWDKAVAFYTGSKEGQQGNGDGVLLYALANDRCIQMNTCGMDGDESIGTASVNIEIFEEFSAGQRHLRMGECASATRTKERIVQYMQIPLIQGTLKYAHLLASEPFDLFREAEGATFAASVLPLVHNCSTEDAARIYSNLKTGNGGNVDFRGVKRALERNYECMGVTCEQVGGIYISGEYAKDARPCGMERDNTIGMAVGISIGFLALAGIVVAYCTLAGPKAADPPELEMRVEREVV
jgi:hypothetical protein